MFWNIFVRPKFRTSDKIDVCVTAFEADGEEFVHALFYKRHLGLDIITASQHVTRELAYKQIYDMGDAIGSHFEFHDASMMCHECKINPVGSMSSEHLCDFCHMEKEYKHNFQHTDKGRS